MIESNFKTFIRYVSLNVFAMLGLSIYILADTLFIANGVGELGLTALNLAIPIFTLVSGLGLLIGIGGATWYAILMAKDKIERASDVFNHAIAFSIIISLIFILASFLAPTLAVLVGADEQTLAMTSTYMRIIMLFSPFFIFNQVLIAFIRNDHNPKLAMFGMLLGSLLNIILDYIFIFWFNWGMLGAALATGATPIFSLLLLSLHFRRKHNHLVFKKIAIKWVSIWKISTLGVSAFITEVANGIVLLVFNLVILSISGNLGVAAYGIIANLSFVAIAIYTGMAQGMQPIVSHLFGKGDNAGNKRILTYALLVQVSIAAIIYLVMLRFRTPVIAWFNPAGNVVLYQIANQGFILYFIGFFFMGFNMIFMAFFSAIEKANVAFRLAVFRGIIIIIPIVLLMSYLFNMTGVWLSFAVTEVITMLLILDYTRRIYKRALK